MDSQRGAIVVRDLLQRMCAQERAQEARTGKNDEGIAGVSPMGDLKEAVQVEKNRQSLIDVVQNLSSLSLSNCSLGDRGLRLLMASFKEGSTRGNILHYLDLTNNGITHKGLKSLTDAMSTGFLSGLRHLILAKNQFGEEGAKLLAGVLRTGRHFSLVGVDLSECWLCDDGMAYLADAFQSGSFKALELQSLDLSSNRFGEEGFLALTRAMVMNRLPSLMFLNLSHNQLREKGTQALAGVLKGGHLPKLTHLLLSRSHLSEEVMPIFRVMEVGLLPNLQAVDVSGNQISGHGSVVLAAALRGGRLSRLQHLNLSQCGIGAQQVHLIAQGIEAGKLTGLQFLDLSHNPIDSSQNEMINQNRASYSSSSLLKGSMAIESLMGRRYLTSLVCLDLSHCSITDQELMALSERMAFGDVQRLQEFLFRGNDIKWKSSIKALVRALESGYLSCLEEIDLGHNTLGEDVNMAFASALTVSSAQGKLAKRLRERLSRNQKSVEADGSVRDHLNRFWKSKSFRGLEAIRTNEARLQPAEKIFNKYLERQYSNHLSPIVNEETAGPAKTPQFVVRALFLSAWVFVSAIKDRCTSN